MSSQSDHVSLPTLMSYGSGQLGAQIFRDTPAVLLPIFMTTMLGVPAWQAGIVILIPKLWVIICDPLVGSWSDRLKEKFGRLTFLLIGAILTSISFFSLFFVTSYSSPLIAAIAICALFFLGSTAFSIYSVPYLALASELSEDAYQRTRVMVFRMVFTIIGVIIGVGAAQPLIFAFGGGEHGWQMMALIFAGLCLVSMLVPAVGLRGTKMVPGSTQTFRLRDQLRSVAGNQPYRILLATAFIQNISQACVYTVLGFMFLYVLDAINLIFVFVLVMSTGSLLSQPVWLRASRRFGKGRAFIFATLLWMAVTTTWVLHDKSSEILATLPFYGPLATDHLFVLLRAFIIGISNSGFVMLMFSMMTDTVDYQRRHHGIAHEGVFAGLFSAAEKLAFAVGPLIAGIVLSLFGFQSSTTGAAVQGADAITGVLMLYSLIPVALQVAALAIFSRYRIDTPAAAVADDEVKTAA